DSLATSDGRTPVVPADLVAQIELRLTERVRAADHADFVPGYEALGEAIRSDLLDFLADRLKVQLREQGARHDLVDAVLPPSAASGTDPARRGAGATAQDDLLLVV